MSVFDDFSHGELVEIVGHGLADLIHNSDCYWLESYSEDDEGVKTVKLTIMPRDS